MVLVPPLPLHPETKMYFRFTRITISTILLTIRFFLHCLAIIIKNKMMNSNVMPSIVQIDRENLRQLVTEVKETLATGYEPTAMGAKQRSFGIVDLWKCHRNRRTATSLRRF